MAFNFVQTALDKLKKTAVSLGKVGVFGAGVQFAMSDTAKNIKQNIQTSTKQFGQDIKTDPLGTVADIGKTTYNTLTRAVKPWYQGEVNELKSQSLTDRMRSTAPSIFGPGVGMLTDYSSKDKKYKFDPQGAFAAGQIGSNVLGAVSGGLSAPNVLGGVGLGAGITALTGGNLKEGIGTSLGRLPSTMGVVKLTDPVIYNTLMKYGLNSGLTTRVATGVANVLQGLLVDAASNFPTTKESVLLDLVTGAVFGSKQFRPRELPTKDINKLISHEGAPDVDRVNFYKDKILRGEPIEPIKIIYEGKGKFGIEDGKHRFEAYKQSGYDQVPVELIPPKDALPIGLSTKPLTKAEHDVNVTKAGLYDVPKELKIKRVDIGRESVHGSYTGDIQIQKGVDKIPKVRQELYKYAPTKEVDIISHEVGHSIENLLPDKMVAKFNDIKGKEFHPKGYNVTGERGGITWPEDFAESYSKWVNQSEIFRKEFPLRAKYFDELGITPQIGKDSVKLIQKNIAQQPLSEVKTPKLQTKLSKQKAEAQLAELQKSKGLQKVGEVTGVTKEGALPSDIVKPSDNLPSKDILPKREYNINATKLKIKPEEEAVLRTTINEITPELEKAKGTKLSNKEVVDAAKKSDLLTKVTVREQTLEANAQMLKARQNMVSLDKDVEQALKSGDTVKLKTKLGELIDSLKVVSAEAADRGRKLQSLAIEAGDESVRASILKDVTKIETDSEKILKEAVNVDWDNAKDVATFYRKFIKPTASEVFDEFRYNNMLSNPRTHLRNAFSNLVQTFVTRPATLMTQGKFVEAGKYYSAVFKNFPNATKAFTDSFGGKTAISKPDIEHIPTQKLPKFLTIPTRAMEASDRFFTKLISEGELARGATVKEAQATAEYSLFRQGLKPEGQGAVLNAIDSATEGVYEMGRKIPILRWFVPFVRTPMNFAKQWIEYSPAGLSTIPGAGNKGEQLAKVVVGSIVTAVGASVALNDRTTWSVPTDPTEKELFYASGRKPYSIKIGDNWVSMQYAGPFAFALALPAAVKYYEEQNRTAMTDDQMTKLGKIASSMAEYLSGQTFMEGLGNFVSLIKGDTDYTLGKNLGYTAGQLIPLNGLVRWVSTMIDPIYRKSTTAGEQLISGIPGLSKTLEPYTMPEGQPSTRETRNLFTPYDITKSKPQYEPMLTKRSAKLQQNAVKNKAKKELEKNKDGTQQISENEVMYWNEDTATVKTLDLSPIKEPAYTGDEVIDKKLKSGYKSKLNSQMNAVIDAYEAGVIPLEMAKELVNNIQKTYDAVTPKSNKFTVKKGTSYTPKIVKVKSMGDLLSSSKSVKLKRKKYKFKRTL